MTEAKTFQIRMFFQTVNVKAYLSLQIGFVNVFFKTDSENKFVY